ncbi:hypothetical protein ABKN59_006305 [Abortiporus biennis]
MSEFSSDVDSHYPMSSLPTPPSTNHRQEKENKLQFKSRVAWSEQNEYHSLTIIPSRRASAEGSSDKKVPTKSILKKSQILLPSIQENQREVTPEPSDPLADLNYLNTPVSTIIALDAALRDLVDAYNLLATRIRASVTGNSEMDATWPLFQPIRTHRDQITSCLIRDLNRALEDPLELPMPSLPEVVEMEIVETEPTALPSPKASPKKKRGMSEEQVKHARDLSSIAQAVLKVLALLFTLPSLHQLFTDEQLRDILTAVLAIPMADTLPTPNARKTCALSIWFLQVQRLPAEVLEPAKDRIAYVIRRGIEGELGKEGKKGSVSDGLKAIHDLSITYPAIFVPAFANILPSLFGGLLAPTLVMRSQACHALGGFAFASASLPNSATHRNIADYVIAFLTTPPSGSPSKTKSLDPADDALIVRTLRTILKAQEPIQAAQGPVWAFCVLASLVIMLRSEVFGNEKIMKLLIGLFTVGMRHKKSSVRALGCVVWSCVTWAYFQPCLPPTPKYVSDEGEDEKDEGEVEEEDDPEGYYAQRLKSGWSVVQSICDMGAGVALIGALLAPDMPFHESEHSRLRRALNMLSTMSKKGGQTCQDALELVAQLTSTFLDASVTASTPASSCTLAWEPMRLLAPSLFDNNPGLLTADWTTLANTIRPIVVKECICYSEVRSLTEEELGLDWVFNGLVNVWKDGLRNLRIFWGCRELPGEVEDVWKGLLKANALSMLDKEDETGLQKFAEKATKVLSDLLRDPLLDLRSDAESKVPKPRSPRPNKLSSSPAQSSSRISSCNDEDKKIPPPHRLNYALKLIVVNELWSILSQNIPSTQMSGPAEKFLAFLTTHEQYLLDEVHEAWAKLCADVGMSCEVAEIDAFWWGQSSWDGDYQKREREWTWDVRSAVWRVWSETWINTESGNGSGIEKCGWESSIILLSVPFRKQCMFEMSNRHLEQWQEMLQYTIDKALDYGVDTVTVLDHLSSTILNNTSSTTLMTCSSLRTADTILSYFIDESKQTPDTVLTELRQIPSDILTFVNQTLLATYPPPLLDEHSDDFQKKESESRKWFSVWLLRSITRMIEGCEKNEEYGIWRDVIGSLQEGLGVWVADEYEALSVEEYALEILPLYQTILLAIPMPTTVDTLDFFSPFLHSGFCGRPAKPEGIKETFETFWSISTSVCPEPKEGWPEKIEAILQVLRSPNPEQEMDKMEHEEVEAQLSCADVDIDIAGLDEILPPSSPILEPTTAVSPSIESIILSRPLGTTAFNLDEPFDPDAPIARSRFFLRDSSTHLPEILQKRKEVEVFDVDATYSDAGTKENPIEVPSTPPRNSISSPPSRPHKSSSSTHTSPIPFVLGSSGIAIRQSGRNKENTSPLASTLPVFASIIERISSVSPKDTRSEPRTPVRLGKRKSIDDDDEEEEETLRKKKTKSSGNPSSTPAISTARFFGLSVSAPLPPRVVPAEESSGDDKHPIKSLLPMIPLKRGRKSKASSSSASSGSITPTPTPASSSKSVSSSSVGSSKKRKGVFMEAVEIPSFKDIRRQKQRRTESLPNIETVNEEPEKAEEEDEKTPTATLRRTRSATKLLGDKASFVRLPYSPKKRTPGSSTPRSNANNATTIVASTSSPAVRKLAECIVAGSDDSIMLATPTKHIASDPPSDDGPGSIMIGQITPHRLVSPAMKRINMMIDSDPPSDDSVLSSSPSRDRVARRSQQTGRYTMKPTPLRFAGKAATRFMTNSSASQASSSSSVFGSDD